MRSGVASIKMKAAFAPPRPQVAARDVSVSVVLRRPSPPHGAYRFSRAACLRPLWRARANPDRTRCLRNCASRRRRRERGAADRRGRLPNRWGRIARGVGVFDDTHGDQAAAPQQIKAATVHRNNRTGHLGLRQDERPSEGPFFEGRKIRLTRGADNGIHQHPARAGIAGVLDQRRNGPLRAAVLVLGPVMNETEIRRVDVGAIAVP